MGVASGRGGPRKHHYRWAEFKFMSDKTSVAVGCGEVAAWMREVAKSFDK